MPSQIPNGCILVARVIQESDIWRKPADWLKLLIYIVLNVNYEDSKLFKRGENMFKYDDIARACHVSYNTVVKFVKWSKDNSILATQKTTRGIVIKVLNYELYQDLENYKGNTKSKTKATQKQHRSNSILKEEKEINNISSLRSDIYLRIFNFWNLQKIIVHQKITKKMSAKIETALSEYNFETIETAIANYATVLHGTDYFWTYQWTLEEFLQRGLTKFADTKPDNFLINKPKKANEPEMEQYHQLYQNG